ncbi:unnamed protein product [Bursaphelenchus xylophilus]|uniref:(pine wood nematode) hypothetical protein n=1 Tax=Bursaphelenchus xylophilus TaxID=6326 RepID=A0A1I7S3S0_BURXY|nr:unnamed protein product [Bursaphelenchus xylophilus]CAG9116490.1 unnamed protein product [Bursaphelenchus xylophilus]
MAPNVSPWNLVKSHNETVSDGVKMKLDKPVVEQSRKERLIERLDNELAHLRAMDVEVVMEKRRCIIKVPMGHFKADGVSVFFSQKKLIVNAVEEVPLDDKTSVLTKLCRRVVIPIHELRTDIMTSYLNHLGILTLTFLKK